MSYMPQPDSLAGRVCAFFRTHPEEELEGRDIATKFGVPSASVSALLASAMNNKVIVREKDSEGTVVYKAGLNLASTDPAAAPPQRQSSPKPAKPAATTVDFPDPESLVVSAGVPIPAKSTTIAARYASVFERMNKGDSFEVDQSAATSLFRSAQIFGKPLNRKFVCRKVDGAKSRIWRTE